MLKNRNIGQTLPPAASHPLLTRASRALSQACLNSSCPLASFSCCRAISSWSFLSLTCASCLSHWERARISLNCFCKSARLFPKTSEEVWILVRGKKRWCEFYDSCQMPGANMLVTVQEERELSGSLERDHQSQQLRTQHFLSVNHCFS